MWIGTVKMKSPSGKVIKVNGDDTLKYAAKGYERIGGSEEPITLKPEAVVVVEGNTVSPTLSPDQLAELQAQGNKTLSAAELVSQAEGS